MIPSRQLSMNSEFFFSRPSSWPHWQPDSEAPAASSDFLGHEIAGRLSMRVHQPTLTRMDSPLSRARQAPSEKGRPSGQRCATGPPGSGSLSLLAASASSTPGLVELSTRRPSGRTTAASARQLEIPFPLGRGGIAGPGHFPKSLKAGPRRRGAYAAGAPAARFDPNRARFSV
jgi:hypothetical protein